MFRVRGIMSKPTAWTFMVSLLFGAPFIGGISKVNIVTVSLGDNPLMGYAAQSPALDVAFQHGIEGSKRLQNASVTRTTFYRPGNFSCADAAVLMPLVAAKVDRIVNQPNEFTVVLSTGCSLEVLALADFAREWNVPLIATISGDVQLTNAGRYPNIISFSPVSNAGRMAVFTKFLERFRWTTISFLCDAVSDIPLSASIAGATCRSLTETLKSSKIRYTYNVQWFDSSIRQTAESSYRAVLLTAASQSRVYTDKWTSTAIVCATLFVATFLVIFILSDPARIRNLMIVAQLLNMTNGDYIYIAPGSAQNLADTGSRWLYSNDNNNQVAIEALQSLVYVLDVSPNYIRIHGLLKEIASRSVAAYNITVTKAGYVRHVKPNDIAICAFEAMESLMTVIQETIGTELELNGRTFRDHFLNRTFDINSRPVTIRENGFRAPDVQFLRLNRTSLELEPAWMYSPLEDDLLEVSSLSRIWRNGNGPPPDRPRCGFRNDGCLSEDSPLAIALYVLLAGFITGMLSAVWWKLDQEVKIARSSWWTIDGAQMTTTTTHHRVRVPNERVLKNDYFSLAVTTNVKQSPFAPNFPGRKSRKMKVEGGISR